MQEEKTITELRKEKKKELKKVQQAIKKLEAEVDKKHWHRDNVKMHLGKLKELDVLYLRRRELKDFLAELDGKRLVRSSVKVMTFSERESGEK